MTAPQTEVPVRRASHIAVVALAATFVPACVGPYKSDFQVIVINRVANTIQVLANGRELGQVPPGQQGSFTLSLNETNSNTFTDGVAPTPQSGVTLNAKDLKTGALSSTKSVALSKDSPSYITFAAGDFPASVPTVARFTASPNNPGVNQDIQFNASASTPSNGTFFWTFGDGRTATGRTQTHRYGQPGTYIVTLTVTSDTGQTATATSTVNVTTTLPGQSANFTFSPATPAVNQDIYFNASTSTVSGATYSWDFGDGTTGTGVTATKRYARAGTYTVVLRATNPVGQSASTARSITVSSTSPQVVASFTFSPTSPAVNQEVFFNASASRPENGNYSWNFGDGETGSGVTPSHRFDAPGTYTVTLTVTNDVGQSATATRTVTVSATSGQVTASFVFSPTIPGVDQEVFFDASASRPTTATFNWNFGDGRTGAGVTPTHRYTLAGTYTVLLVVTNEFGQTATTSRTITVSLSSSSVIANFTFSPTSPGINQDVFFNASASRPTDGTFMWNFGDGATGGGVTPTHRYAQAATYSVTLTVTNDAGQFATTSRSVTVTSTGPLTADFTFSPTDPSISRGTNSVIFDATPSSASAVSWTWDFGDGTAVETGRRVTHTFTRVGTWVVRLTIADADGRIATVTKNVTVAQ